MTLSNATIQSLVRSPSFACYRKDFSVDIQEKILRYGAPVGSRLECHHSLGRCMDRLREMIHEAELSNTVLESGTVVMASRLSKSSGRFERYWHAPEGGLWLAISLADVLLPEFNRLLPFCIGVACCQAVRMYGVEASLKWVNDVHLQGQKIAGVLSETIRSQVRGERYHLIGIGININNTTFPGELQNSAVSLSQLTGKTHTIENFALKLLAHLTWALGLLHFQEEEALKQSLSTNVAPVLSVWRNLSDSVGKKVVYGFDVQQKPLYGAIVETVDDDGGLVMRLADGHLITEHSGEIQYLDP